MCWSKYDSQGDSILHYLVGNKIFGLMLVIGIDIVANGSGHPSKNDCLELLPGGVREGIYFLFFKLEV